MPEKVGKNRLNKKIKKKIKKVTSKEKWMFKSEKQIRKKEYIIKCIWKILTVNKEDVIFFNTHYILLNKGIIKIAFFLLNRNLHCNK